MLVCWRDPAPSAAGEHIEYGRLMKLAVRRGLTFAAVQMGILAVAAGVYLAGVRFIDGVAPSTARHFLTVAAGAVSYFVVRSPSRRLLRPDHEEEPWRPGPAVRIAVPFWMAIATNSLGSLLHDPLDRTLTGQILAALVVTICSITITVIAIEEVNETEIRAEAGSWK